MKCIVKCDQNDKVIMNSKTLRNKNFDDFFQKKPDKIIMTSRPKLKENSTERKIKKEPDSYNAWYPKNVNTTSKLSRKVTKENQIRKVPTTCKKMSTSSCIQYFDTKNNIKRPVEKEIDDDDSITMESIFDTNMSFFMASKINTSEVKKKSEKIDLAVRSANQKFGKNFVDLPNKIGFCSSREEFDRYLDIYRANQEFYINTIEEKDDEFKKKVTELEQWFIKIIPYKPIIVNRLEIWHQNETFKLQNRRTKYCDARLIPYLNEISIKYLQSQYLLDDDIIRYAKSKGVNIEE